MIRILSVVIASLLIAAAAQANFGPPYVPKDRRVADPPLSFPGVENHPDYTFYLYYSISYAPAVLIEVKNKEPFKLDFKEKERIASMRAMTLLAMKREDFERLKKEDPSLKWLTEEKKAPAGLLHASLKPLETTVPIAEKETPLTTYRVAIKEGKLSAEKVESKKADDKKTAPNSSSLAPPWVLGVVISISLAWLGLWFARRGKGVR